MAWYKRLFGFGKRQSYLLRLGPEAIGLVSWWESGGREYMDDASKADPAMADLRERLNRIIGIVKNR